MIFNSLQFALFLPVVLVALRILPTIRSRQSLILAASYFFYGIWDWRFLGLLLVSTVVDFAIGLLLHRSTSQRRRRGLLLASMATNLGILATFKYLGFFVESFEAFLEPIGLAPSSALTRIVLPVGISFYTFQTMSYTIDIYRKILVPTRSLLLFATFVAYFPQLVAGPIERASRLMPQLETLDERNVTSAMRREGIWFIFLGLFRKVVLADTLAPVVNNAFDNPGRLSALSVAAGVIAFAFQIYGDFAGYTDIARGVSRLMGVELMENFAQPYLSRNITEFWRRWHISLSTWLRDYLYISLGGNRQGRPRQYANQMITMLLGGLWHGASWNFVVWGGIHGAMLAIHRISGGVPGENEPVRGTQIWKIVGTFGIVCASWIFFRAADFAQAIDVLSAIVTLNSGVTAVGDLALVIALGSIAIGIDLIQRNRITASTPVTSAAVTLGLVAIVVCSGGASVPFIYFQF